MKIALAPARKAKACSDSVKRCLPAARRMMEEGRTRRAVQMVRSMVRKSTGCGDRERDGTDEEERGDREDKSQ